MPGLNMKNWKFSALLSAPVGVVMVVAAAVFGTEMLLMLLLDGFLKQQFELSGMAWNVIDAISLVAVVSPVLYFLVFREMLESEDRFRQINTAVQDAIIVIDEQGLITEW